MGRGNERFPCNEWFRASSNIPGTSLCRVLVYLVTRAMLTRRGLWPAYNIREGTRSQRLRLDAARSVIQCERL